MNIRRGLTRLWVALTVIWLTLGAVFSWTIWQKPAQFTVDELKARATCSEANKPKDLLEDHGLTLEQLRAIAIADATARAECEAMTKNAPWLRYGPEIKLGSEFSEMSDSDWRLMQSQINKEAIMNSIKSIASSFGIFVAVAAVFWALLYTGFWIATGFRQHG